MKKAVVGVALAAACTCAAKETILVAADPFAVGLKNAVVKHLEERGFAVKDLGATDANKDKPYFESAVDVCRALQRGEAKRAFLFCGTGMGMSMIANRFKGVRAAVVESVFAAKMCRLGRHDGERRGRRVPRHEVHRDAGAARTVPRGRTQEG